MDLYEPLNVIGSGSFGVIRKVRRKSDGKIFARKEIDYRKMSERERKQLVAEVNILRELRHPYIVRYFERHIDRENSMIYIIMEYCEGGDLAAVVRKAKKLGKRFSEDQIWNLLAQLLLALHECHHGASGKSGPHPPILHRDIKPDNVFLDSQNNAKLGDFGLSRLMDGSDFARTYVGTPFYMSPELISESAYNAKSDIWALGCVVYELCTLEPPFQGKTQSQLAARIQRGVIEPLSRDYSRELFQFMREMLRVKHERRPCTTILLEHPRIRQCLHLDQEPEPPAVTQLPHVPDPEEELRQRIAAVEAAELALRAREEEWRRDMAAREDYFNSSMLEQKALVDKLKQTEQSLLHTVRVRDMELARKDAELNEVKTLLQRAQQAQNTISPGLSRRSSRTLLNDRATYNKE
ncbi:kinase-like domain-containing protein [Geranomyces variabilis]|nr:kinase-like domain-containing protein [Geranomyces variabilis]KAJ3139861.1 G2-specific serine/threonine protein kinase [Geranomyces variabilis]